jgi:exosortase O
LFLAVLAVWLKNACFIRPVFHWPSYAALTLMAAGLAIFGVLKVYSPIRIFSFVAAMLFFYGLLGFVLKPHNWIKGTIPFLLLIMTLPFGRHLDVFVGYPLRMLSVDACYSILKPFEPGLFTKSSLLILENRASHIDMDCSGVKGLWVGLIFLFFIGWIERQVTLRKWLSAAGFLVFWLVMGNVLRILLLTLIHIVWVEPGFDRVVHHSSSVFFLVTGICGIYFILRNKSVRKQDFPKVRVRESKARVASICVAVFTVSFLIVHLLPAFGTPAVEKPAALERVFLDKAWLPIPLSSSEKRFFMREGVSALKFKKENLQLLMVLNGDWRSQHKPEHCYELSGYELSQMQTQFIGDSLSCRKMSFLDKKPTAFYWFQNGRETTGDFAQKVWSQLRGTKSNWTLVSVMDKKGTTPKAELQHIYQILSQNLAHD